MASVPVPRIHVHVRRLVEAGYRVGVVRQAETAAVKAAGANKSAPFERRLAAVYTRATLQASSASSAGWGCLCTAGIAPSCRAASHVVSVLPSHCCMCSCLAALQQAPSSQFVVRHAVHTLPLRPAWLQAGELAGLEEEVGGGSAASYVCCVVEEPARARGGSPAAAAAKGAVDVGLVCVEASTGDVLHGQFRDGLLRIELESQLRRVAPAELLLVEPLSEPTARLLACFGSQLAATAPAATAGGGPGPARLQPSTVRAERVSASSAAKYREGGALAAVLGALGGGSSSSSGDGISSSNRGGMEDDGDGSTAAAAMDAALRLQSQPLVLRALAHALDYLRPLGVDAVLRQGASFRPLTAVTELALSANALQQLEVLRSGEGGEKGSLLWLLDRTLTSMGARLLRSWVGRPLRQQAAIEERLEAVEELLQQGERLRVYEGERVGVQGGSARLLLPET